MLTFVAATIFPSKNINKEIIEVACRITEAEILTMVGQKRPGNSSVLVVSTQKGKNIFGFGLNPKDTDIETIIQTAWNWHKSHINRFYDVMINNKSYAV